MRSLRDSWKYIFKNLWFVLPFAVLPAVFLALSLDYTAIYSFMHGFFSGEPRFGFIEYFRVWSFIRIDSWLGGIYTVFAFVSILFCSALMLAFVEKHMRIGKRSLSGVASALKNVLFSAFLITLVYTALYEIWAIIFSAVIFMVSSIHVTALVYVLFIAAFLLFTYGLLYVVTVFYLWLPCRQMTGFGPYNAFLYSYRLMVGIRWELVLSYLISFVAALLLLGAASFAPEAVFRIVAIVVYVVLFLSFLIRMETAYFATDKLDREDSLQSYREY